MPNTLPPCGLYRTLLAHPTRPTDLPSKRLVYFHNHSTSGPPVVLLPKDNQNNRWTFHPRGILVEDPAWCHTLVAQRPEGFYTVGESFPTARDRTVAEGQIAQLGYNRNGEPILFFPARDDASNALTFPTRGMRVGPEVIAALRWVDTRGPFVPPADVH